MIATILLVLLGIFFFFRYFPYVVMLLMAHGLAGLAYFLHLQEMLVPVLVCFIVAIPYMFAVEKLKEKLQ